MSTSGLGRSNTVGGHRQHQQPQSQSQQGARDSNNNSQGTSGVRRHVSLHVGDHPRGPASNSSGGKSRSASSSLTIDTSKTNASNNSDGSSHSSPLTKSPIAPNALGRTPWSPTAEEAAKLISGQPASKASVDNVRDAFHRLDIEQDPSANNNNSSSSASPSNPASAAGTPAGGKRLPPLTTSFTGGAQVQSPASASAAGGNNSAMSANKESPALMPYRGPSSAAAFVRPVGGFNSSQHRMFEERPNRNIPLHNNGAATATVGEGANDWFKQKALIAGDPRPAPSSNSNNANAKKWQNLDEQSTISEETRSVATESPPPLQSQRLPAHLYPSTQQSSASTAYSAPPAASVAPSPPSWTSPYTNSPEQQLAIYQQQLQQQQQNLLWMHTHTQGQLGPNMLLAQQQAQAQAQAQAQMQAQQSRPTLSSLNTNTSASSLMPPYSHPGGASTTNSSSATNSPATALPPNLDIQSLAMAKGWNPPRFDCKPPHAKFCVIKSYTEDDIHKSIKYEIWCKLPLCVLAWLKELTTRSQRARSLVTTDSTASSKRARLTDLSISSSLSTGLVTLPVSLRCLALSTRQFPAMFGLTPSGRESSKLVSEPYYRSRWIRLSLTIWLQLRWIYIKDVPNNALRHLRLNNTQENKPVTSSRDTQEVPYEVGTEMLRIITSYNSKTSLLQDFAYYGQSLHFSFSNTLGLSLMCQPCRAQEPRRKWQCAHSRPIGSSTHVKPRSPSPFRHRASLLLNLHGHSSSSLKGLVLFLFVVVNTSSALSVHQVERQRGNLLRWVDGLS